MRFAICNELLDDRPLDEAFRFIAETGYAAVELAPYTIAEPDGTVAPERLKEVKRLADRYGLAFTGLHWLLTGTRDLHVGAAEPERRHRTLEYLRMLTRLCADLGGQVLVFGSPAQRSTPPGVSRADNVARAVDMFADWGETAREHGVTVCLESLPVTETDVLNTTQEVIDVVRAIDSPAVRMVLDVKSMSAEQRPIPQLIELAAPYFTYFQANDANRGGPGFGTTDFVPVFQALAAVGYDGDVSVEAFDRTPGATTVARRSLAYLRSCERRAARTNATPTKE
ncbi:sugar phosphate isomerase/epimerase family protein [Streptomyces chromofuscus]|uniref:Sugar phosphate isomerase/epimerase n=1 Tax=Streptomyces chromofuscus TaxID=42881 RepID=A0A7M2T7T3_STRCW|nr:sugar phosphate isomerase/epimerase [Streptomyces chromofuscus]QOV44776.1 sugar phosphate isomerase/epimerase [Streptomyces chromofuscus]GGT00306.1 tagatose 3-epimerase [Streptomyces chromofuscus]